VWSGHELTLFHRSRVETIGIGPKIYPSLTVASKQCHCGRIFLASCLVASNLSPTLSNSGPIIKVPSSVVSGISLVHLAAPALIKSPMHSCHRISCLKPRPIHPYPIFSVAPEGLLHRVSWHQFRHYSFCGITPFPVSIPALLSYLRPD
jgi:hypothetical protein